MARLIGNAGLDRLLKSRVMVVGVGGVGSWAVEALARSGVGNLILVDLDEICVSNVNRQLPALDGTIGRLKVEVLAERCRLIHPGIQVEARAEFFLESTQESLLGLKPDGIIDAMDSVPNKCRLISECVNRGIPVVTCGAAGGKLDATLVRVMDLSRTTHDRLLSEVRRRLRREHGFPRSEKRFGVEAVTSPETMLYPAGDGTVCEKRPDGADGRQLRLNCESGFGSATFVTGTFGFAAASAMVRRLARE